MSIEVGSKVRKRGDNEMVVVEIRGQRAVCEWTDRSGGKHTAEVALTQLVETENPDANV